MTVLSPSGVQGNIEYSIDGRYYIILVQGYWNTVGWDLPGLLFVQQKTRNSTPLPKSRSFYPYSQDSATPRVYQDQHEEPSLTWKHISAPH